MGFLLGPNCSRGKTGRYEDYLPCVELVKGSLLSSVFHFGDHENISSCWSLHVKTPVGQNPGSCGILCRSTSLGEQPLLCVQEDVGNVSLSCILFFREVLQGCTGYKKVVGVVVSLSQEPGSHWAAVVP